MQSESRPRVLITGAGTGIGRACAHALADCGAELILCDNDSRALVEISQALGAASRFCDVSSEASVAIFAADILEQFPSLDMIVNAAGGGYERTLGMYRVSRALMPALKRGEQCNIIINVPPAGSDSEAIFPYASSSQAFQRLSSALAMETRGSAVNILNACPKGGSISYVLPDANAWSWPVAWTGEPVKPETLESLAIEIASLLVRSEKTAPQIRRIVSGPSGA